jgi:hypothetical protein
VLTSCPVKLPDSLRWMKSGRFIRLVPAIVGLSVLGGVLYNATMVDRVPPSYVIRVSSLSSDGKALTLTAINVAFSKEVQHDTADKAFSITPSVDGTFHWQGRTMIWTPSSRLPLSTKFLVRVAPGVRDLDGNTNEGSGEIAFETVGPPRVVAVSPVVSAAAVPVDASIQVTFDRLMDTQKVTSGISFQPELKFTTSWNAEVLTIKPTGSLSYATTYTLSIGSPASDSDGSGLATWKTTFKTVGIGLRVRSVSPTSGVAGVSIHSAIAVVFDGPLDPASVSGAISLTPPASGSTSVKTLPTDSIAVAAAPSGSASGSAAAPTSATVTAAASATSGPFESNVLVFTPDGALSPHTTYTVTMTSTVKRIDGEAATAQSWSFTTGEAPVSALNQVTFISNRSGVANVWLMNPDGSNQREVTSELVPVTGFDVSGDGATIAYSAGGVVKRMSVTGENLGTLTPSGYFEYAPTFTPNGTALIVGRRDSTGKDLGYWLVPMISGSDQRQLLQDGAPPTGSVDAPQPGLGATAGATDWWSRAVFSQDGQTLMIVRGADDVIELVDLAGASAPVKSSIIGNSRGVWVQAEGSFYTTGALSSSSAWSYWRVGRDGSTKAIGAADADMDYNGRTLVYVMTSVDGSRHLAASTTAGGTPTQLTTDPQYSESSPSWSPDSSTIVFARVGNLNPALSAGIWTVKPDGSGLTNLSVDGTCPRWLP